MLGKESETLAASFAVKVCEPLGRLSPLDSHCTDAKGRLIFFKDNRIEPLPLYLLSVAYLFRPDAEYYIFLGAFVLANPLDSHDGTARLQLDSVARYK